MSFIKLDKRIGVAEAKLGASMSMRLYKGSPKAMAFLSLRSAFLATTGFAKARQFDVAVGDGDDAGKIRVAPNTKGAFPARELKSGSLILDLGHLPQLGNEPHGNHQAAVELIDGAAIVTVPEWSDEDEGDDEDDEEVDLPKLPLTRTAPVKVEPPRATYSPPAPHAAAGKSVVHKGITITLTPDRERVSFKGETIEVSPRGAKLVEALAKVMPSCIDDAHLVARLWDAKPPAGASTQLEMICRDLAGLKKLGLEIRLQKGIGRQLVIVP